MFLGPYLLRQLVFVFSRGLLQLCDACLLLLYHWAQVFNAVVVWQLIFGHLQAATRVGKENRRTQWDMWAKAEARWEGSLVPQLSNIHSFLTSVFPRISLYTLLPSPPLTPLLSIFSGLLSLSKTVFYLPHGSLFLLQILPVHSFMRIPRFTVLAVGI